MNETDCHVLEPDDVLRDEFACPITCEVMKDPVIAADGHTYDRAAIQRWFSRKGTSPKTGQLLDQLTLIDNVNLRRLINDLVAEGGRGLYRKSTCASESAASKRLLCRGRYLMMKCSESSEQSIRSRVWGIGEEGCVVGRAESNLIQLRDDRTVSRAHFEISYDPTRKRFGICDLGSSSGTFVRLRHGSRVPLHEDLVFKVGKHVVKVLSTCSQTAVPVPAPELTLQCIGPVGSPLEGKQYVLGRAGGYVGRDPQAQVSFTTRVGAKNVSVDAAISMHHASIVGLETPGEGVHFALLDGCEERCSRNGTWIKLHVPQDHDVSEVFELSTGAEVAAGNSQFEVAYLDTVIEKELDTGAA